MKNNNLDDISKYVICEDVPNLGSIITLDNKGRLINSQFSKPSSSQTLLKLNSTEEVPDADDLPYSIISYGDTPNIINLPYNDHNYVSVQNSKKFENYDRKALDFISKQSSQSSNRLNFSNNNSVRISHYSSYNTSTAQNDAIFFGDKYKAQNQFIFNQQISQSSTPLVTNKTISSISQNNNNNMYVKNKIVSSAIVINSGSVNKLKNMNVIQLRRPAISTTSISDTRINYLPLKKPSVLTNIMANNQSNGEINSEKTDLLKSINLIPRCICAFTHDDGGMIRCEICRTWQHIICMYPDNKFPIYYKCERCEPRDVDIKRAVTTQTNILIKTGYNPSDFVAHQQYNEYDLDNDNLENNNFTKSSNGSHFVIVQPDMKTVSYRSSIESMQNTSMPIFIGAAKDAQTVPPGSPRTSKRKQDLISLKSVITKPSILNLANVNSKIELQKLPISMETSTNNYTIPTSSNKLLIEQNEVFPIVNDMSDKLISILNNRVQSHTNLTNYHQQYLKQNNYVINTNMYEVVLIDYSCYAIKAVVEFSASEIIMEYNGYVSLAEEYNSEYDFKRIYDPYVLFYDKFEHLPLCVNSKLVDNESRYVRRSCTPNAEVKHRLLQDGQMRFYIVPINRISKDSEITIAFDYNFMKCRYPVECACNQSSCQLLYLKQASEAESQRDLNDLDSQNMNTYECANINVGPDIRTSTTTMTRPYKKRGRGSKLLNTSNRPISDNLATNVPKTDVKIVRRNKRGRPPLNRSVGIQRADIVVKPPPPPPQSESSASNNTLSDCKNVSDSESIHSQSNENVHPQISIHNNFQNFKRISANHWSLKANRKMAAITKKTTPLKKIIIPPKVGRPTKIKKIEPIKLEPETDSEHSKPDTSAKIFPKKSQLYYNDKNDDQYDSYSPQSTKQDMSRDDDYWLEEINNKILKQKAKEAKRIQRKRKKMSHRNINIDPIDSPIEIPDKVIEPEPKKLQMKELKTEAVENEPLSIGNEKKEQVLKKSARGRKSLKANTNLILSYKPSSIDDLKKDWMLISASLEEEKEKAIDEEQEEEEAIQEEIKNEESCVNEVVIEESFCEFVGQALEDSCTKEEELDNSLGEPSNRSRSKRSSLNKSSDSAKERAAAAAKASREERWVNIMWQRILKNETPEEKSKRRRSKSSAAEGSVASEEYHNEPSEIGSPKIGNSELSEDRDSSSNSKVNSAQKVKKKMKLVSTSCTDSEEMDVSGALKNNSASTISSGSAEDHKIVPDQKETSEQCGLIVYKEQHSNPMEKFSRENSTKLVTPDPAADGSTSNILHPPHTKKRWLSQALMEETYCEEAPVQKPEAVMSDEIIDKLSSIESASKRSFLPPVFTTADSSDLSLMNAQKVAINPKKRLLNQFSMEDNAPITNTDSNPFMVDKPMSRSHVQFKSFQSEPNIDQEQGKTKLSLSEYRKRRTNNRQSSENIPSLSKYSKLGEEFNNGWVGMEKESTKKTSWISDNVRVKKSESECYKSPELSILDTLNNLAMPSNLDPRLAKLAIPTDDKSQDLPIIAYQDSECNDKMETFDPKSPSDTQYSDNDERMMYINGPRTPSDNEDMSNNVRQTDCPSPGFHHSDESIHSFESQPSPTSDSHFDLEKDAISCDRQTTENISHWPKDWTSTASSIGKMAGIKNPDMLQEIDEFEDEYIPLPENLPTRTKEELETLLLTQKRDSQIREWQEVKQLEREKVKLDHQVRSMERKLQHRTNKKTDTKGHSGTEDQKQILKKDTKNPLANYDVKDDEKTMKTFNVQLANINGLLMAQISSLRMPDGGSERSSVEVSPGQNKLTSGQQIKTDNQHTTTSTVYNRFISSGSYDRRPPPTTQPSIAATSSSELRSTIV